MRLIQRCQLALFLGVTHFLACQLFAAETMKVEVDTTQIARHLLHSKITLPSKPGELHFAGQARSIRVPDFSRMRFVR